MKPYGVTKLQFVHGGCISVYESWPLRSDDHFNWAQILSILLQEQLEEEKEQLESSLSGLKEELARSERSRSDLEDTKVTLEFKMAEVEEQKECK